jgi:hemerythrin-like metal-binding protein
MYPESGSEIDSLITAADNAMYQSKSLGKNRFTLHQTESRSQVSTKSWLEFGAAHMVGIAEIDAQHQAIATMLNRLNDSLRNSEPQEGLVQQLEGVVASVATHFETEEDLMAQSDYPDAQSHMIQHKRLLAEVEHLKLRFLEGGELLALQWLKDWFFGHILGSDIQFGSFLAKLEPKAHPET